MKFVAVAQAKGLTPGSPQQVYTLNANGEYGVGRLVSRTEDVKGLHLKFEVPQYASADKPPRLEPVIVENITHVCIQKDRSEAGELKLASNVPAEAKV